MLVFNVMLYELIFLNKFINYIIVLVGFIFKGDGNFSWWFVVLIDEDSKCNNKCDEDVDINKIDYNIDFS